MSTPKPHLLGLVAGVCLAGGLVVAAGLLARAWTRIAEAEIVTVTGAARRNVSSDLVVWRGTVSVEAPTLLEAQSRLRDHTRSVATFLDGRGFTNAQFPPIAITRLAARATSGDGATAATTGYRLGQTVEIRSGEIDRVLAMDAATPEIVRLGVEFTTQAPEFVWTRAGEAKVEMLAEATRDARARAGQIASEGGRSISRLRSARMGVFQVNPLHSIQTSWEGANDTTSREKTVSSVVNATFSLR